MKAATPPALTINEAIAALKCSRPTLYKMMNLGEMKFIYIRGRRRIPFPEIERLNNEGTRKVRR
jgi:excisionase family DNA binding protein